MWRKLSIIKASTQAHTEKINTLSLSLPPSLSLSLSLSLSHTHTHIYTHTHILVINNNKKYILIHTLRNTDILRIFFFFFWTTNIWAPIIPLPATPLERDRQTECDKDTEKEAKQKMWKRPVLSLPVCRLSWVSCTLLVQRREVSGMLLHQCQGEDDRTAACPKKSTTSKVSHLVCNCFSIRNKNSQKPHPENLSKGLNCLINRTHRKGDGLTKIVWSVALVQFNSLRNNSLKMTTVTRQSF